MADINFAFMDGDVSQCEELRRKGEVLEFSHNDIREALLSGNLELVLWLITWYKEQWKHYCRNYYPLPNAIMGGNTKIADTVWEMSLLQPEEEKFSCDISLLGTQTPTEYALQSNNPEMLLWVEKHYPEASFQEKDLLNSMHQNHEDAISWVLENREVECSEELFLSAIECLCEKVAVRIVQNECKVKREHLEFARENGMKMLEQEISLLL
ncbi:hypothetical protein MEL_319 [Melbournevirus]|uniref:hypothetical protein n=1 Tax=Melbournevirus TaxID=1560514 RepID=UPI00051F59B0|nr:hypothetical protein MEL_319 [Melbournevirus]AIT54932.1 ankyrin repeat-containing protein [Melbournevirus]